MGERIALATTGGKPFSAWRAAPGDARRGGLIVLHPIWGVTPHIREFSDGLAAQGYEVIAPSLIDGTNAFPDLNTDFPILAQRLAMGEASGWGAAAMDVIQATIDALNGPVFLLGFCFGGSTAWLAAARCEGLSAVACFYGGDIVNRVDETPKVPTILHFGTQDEGIPPQDVATITAAHPDLPIWLYPAGHAFVAPTAGYHEDSAKLAMLRTLQHFQRGGGTKGEV
ncbi:MAG: dienelactone hydrolase family protein [Caulobacterales bacterium]|nr:dienelactone hydrolase family protein [Caulobacterales bacterium]